MKVEIASVEDLEDLYPLWMELMVTHKAQHPVFVLAPESRDEALNILRGKLEKPDTRIFVVRDQTKFVGMLIASFLPGSEAFVLNKKGYIAETIVTKNYRSRGLGRELFERAREWLLEKGIDHLELQVSVNNFAAKEFWIEMGFNPSTIRMIREL